MIRTNGQGLTASIEMLGSACKREWVTVTNEKGDETFDIFCPSRLATLVERLEEIPRHVLAKSENAPLTYSYVVGKSLRA